ncbi:FecCD family ABC transporter permease [Nocardioides jishulii]|uniref:Iron ABC transporter permease n=1 Tax=Nocardioides jishulii TaxID=2575440 RepID=A0A4U2YR79_9ACTN|nr:iron chelate uptake ABC transporter family permease subunit [Nocardioides jishulii]QCX26279.1 iron chelate uptake ABC transporter family permease subunit [Nocardioides jishulii]TKI63917.1 iron ABC transporter permease [Nocardioides jishulii]
MTEAARPSSPASRRRVLGLVGATTALVVVAALSLAVGARQVPLAEVVRAFTDFVPTSDDHVVVRELRLPRLWLACAVGAALAVSGALVQTLTRNPLAEPGILGVTAGASFAIVVATAAWGVDSQVSQLLAAGIGAVVATVAVYAVGRDNPLRLLLAGVALSAVLAGLGLGVRLMMPDVFDNYRFWSVGSLAGREQVALGLPLSVIVVALVAVVLLVPSLSAMALGEHVATTLGARVRTTRVLTVVVLTVLAAAATAVAGPIGFVGLIVPHLVRRLASGSIGWLMVLCVLGGPVLVLTADVLARVLLPTGEVPVAVVTAFLGGPVLIWVVRRYGTVGL